MQRISFFLFFLFSFLIFFFLLATFAVPSLTVAPLQAAPSTVSCSELCLIIRFPFIAFDSVTMIAELQFGQRHSVKPLRQRQRLYLASELSWN